MAIKSRINRHGVVEYGIDFYKNGRGSKRKQVWGFGSEAEARKGMAQIDFERKQRANGVMPYASPKLAELFSKHLAVAAQQGKRQEWHARRVFDFFLALLPKSYLVTHLTTADFDAYIEARAKEVKPATIRRELTVVSAALNAASRYFRELNNFRPPKIYYPRNSRRRRERIIEPHELDLILGYLLAPKKLGELQTAYDARKRVGHVFAVGMLTGARLGEVARIQWEHLKPERKVLLIVGKKTEFTKDTPKFREVPLTPKLQAVFAERRKCTDSRTFVFFKSERVPPTFYEILKKACEDCGLHYGNEDGIVFHHLRHTAISTWLRGGADLGTVQGLTGSTPGFVLHYAHLTKEGREKAGQIADDELGRFIVESK